MGLGQNSSVRGRGAHDAEGGRRTRMDGWSGGRDGVAACRREGEAEGKVCASSTLVPLATGDKMAALLPPVGTRVCPVVPFPGGGEPGVAG